MSSKFNPYAEWFGLNASSKPTYYELLGVPNFETEPPVIAEAAEVRLQQLQAHRGGPHAEYAERLSREVTGVMNVLLSPDKRRQYDEQLRRQAPAAQPQLSPSTDLPPALDAAESPTMMLPPGSFSMPPQGAQPGLPSAMPGANPYGSYPGYGSPEPQQPYYAGPQGFPNGAMPPGAPQYAPAAAYPAAASPFGQPAAPVGYVPGFPPGAQPAYAGSPQMMGPQMMGAPQAMGPQTMVGAQTVPVAGGATYSNSNVSQRTRMAGARKQKSSNTMMATAIIGGAGVVLLVLILAVAASLNKDKGSAVPPKVIAKKPNPLPQDPSLNQFEKAMMALPPPLEDSDFPSQGGFTYRSTPDEVLKNEARMRDMPNTDGVGGLSMPDLISKMAPTGVTPSIATPAPVPAAKPTATPSGFPPPSPAFAVPSATPSATAMVAATPSAPSPPPVLTGMTPSEVKMEAALPPDAVRAKSIPTMLGAARKAMKDRDYGKAEEIVLQAQVMADTPELITSTFEHGRVVEHLRVFWNAVREGVKAMPEGEELPYNGKVVKVVKHDDINLIVKQDNKDVVIPIDKLLPTAAVMLAERGLPQNDPATKIAVACFLACSDKVDDRDRAMLLLSEASAAGTDVTNLKAALSTTP